MEDTVELDKLPLSEQARAKLSKIALEHGFVYANIIDEEDSPKAEEPIYLEEIHLSATSGTTDIDFEINEFEVLLYSTNTHGERRNYSISEDGVFEESPNPDEPHSKLLDASQADKVYQLILNSEADVKKIQDEFSFPPVGGDMKFWANDRQNIPYPLPFPKPQ